MAWRHHPQALIVIALAGTASASLSGYALGQYTISGVTPFYNEKPMDHQVRLAEDPSADDPWLLDTSMAKAAYRASDRWKPSRTHATS